MNRSQHNYDVMNEQIFPEEPAEVPE